MAGIKGKSGGARPNAGRPKKTLTQQQVSKIIKAVEKKGKENGISWSDSFAEMLFDPVANYRERLQAFRLFMEITISKSIEQNINVNKNQAPKIYLPEKRPDPAKVIPIQGKR
jgi:hypothetical protein